MRKRPKGRKYRNLSVRGGAIYYERLIDGRRVRFSTKTDDWELAAVVRDAYEERKGVGTAAFLASVPIFAETAARYLEEGTEHLAGTTLDDRHGHLGPEGILTAYFGPLPIDEISTTRLAEWWYAEVQGKGRSERTGLVYLSSLSAVLRHARRLGILATDPIALFRSDFVRSRAAGKRGRENQTPKARPIEDLSDLRAFVEQSEAAGSLRHPDGRPVLQRRRGHIADLLQLEAGLRLSEVAGLRWRDVRWGNGPDDLSRAVVVRESIARDKHEGAPKSGRMRTVAMSRRLRSKLRELWMEAGQPDEGDRVLPGFHQRNYRKRHFDKVCGAANIHGHTPKDLRDTYASQLLTAGIQLGYISSQLGHSTVAVTARHYARWTAGEAYREPFRLNAEDVPADLLARFDLPSSPSDAEAGTLCGDVQHNHR